jgi:hypothetical protein
MAWYNKHVQPHVNRMAVMPRHLKQAFLAFMKPNHKRRGWIVGSSLLLLAAPVSAFALTGSDNKVHHTLGDVLSSSDELTKQSVDISVENAVGQYGQNTGSTNNGLQGGAESHSGDVNLQATFTDSSADVTVNGNKTQLDPLHDSYSETITSDDGKTNIDITIKNGGSSSGSTKSTSSNIHITSSSSSTSDSYEDDRSESDYYRSERDR